MKKNYALLKVFIVLLSLFTVKLNAQLSGVVTINSGAATAGTNYQSFTALASALNTSGINGTLVVNVTAAGGYTEQPLFHVIAGTSATNTITINGNGALLTFSSTNSSQPWTLGLDGADYMTFNNLNVSGIGTYAYVCDIANGADHNTFSACSFSANNTGSSTNQIAVVMCGSVDYYYNQANSGNYNTWTNCTIDGGYYGFWLYGNYNPPYNTNNRVLNCNITNFYYGGIYHYYYHKNNQLKGNNISRPNRTNTSSTSYGIYSYYTEGSMIEGNHIFGVYDAMTSNSNTFYGIYCYWNNANGGKVNPNTIRNNIISDIKHNGTDCGIRAMYIDGYVYHNTISLDYAGATGGTTYGIYAYTQSGYEMDVKNNIVSITRGGSGTKYCMYSGGNTTGITFDKNDYYLNAPAGTNYIGYFSNTATSLSALQSQGIEPNGFSTDPMFTSIPSQNYIPTSGIINNAGTPVGVYTDFNNFTRSGTQPDIGAHEYLSANCISTPSLNSVSPANFTVCAGESIQMGLANYYSDLGISYQWRYSYTSAAGIFTNVAGATGNQFTTPSVNQDTWYSVVITCANGGGSIAPVGEIDIATTLLSSVPYHESFEGITATNKLPNCSWTSSSPGANALSYTTTMNQNRSAHTGNKFGAFYTSYVSGTTYFYTNGIQLNAGITYSASVWYQTDFNSNSNVTDLSILYGTSQSPSGLVSIVSTNGAVISPTYKLLGNTFQVPASGIYYVAVAATSDGNYGTEYVVWDDLDISIPCSLNSPTVAVSTSTTSLCKGESLNLVASGADDYVWSNGATGGTVSDIPVMTGMYSVVATNTLSGCAVTLATPIITVNPSPVMTIYTNKPISCSGEAVNLVASGSGSNVWSTAASGNIITVNPTSTTSYTVVGTNGFGCTGIAVQQVSVIANPTVTVTGQNEICAGETAELTGNGAVTYSWSTSAVFILSPVALVNPMVSMIYTLSGSDSHGCVGKTTYALTVNECTGITKINATSNGIHVYPNPTAGVFVVESNTASAKTIEVTDLTGRVLFTNTGTAENINVNIGNFANGIYYVKIQSDKGVDVIKVVKH